MLPAAVKPDEQIYENAAVEPVAKSPESPSKTKQPGPLPVKPKPQTVRKPRREGVGSSTPTTSSSSPAADARLNGDSSNLYENLQ